jgi:hypothetical protein
MRDKSALAAVCALLLASCQRTTEVRGSDDLTEADGALVSLGERQAVIFAGGSGSTCDRLRAGPLREGALVLKLLPGTQQGTYKPATYTVAVAVATASERGAGAYLRKPQSEPACVSDILLASDGTITLAELAPDGARGSFDLWFGSSRHLTGRFSVRRCEIPPNVEPCY